jgi:hypothetical protein
MFRPLSPLDPNRDPLEQNARGSMLVVNGSGPGCAQLRLRVPKELHSIFLAVKAHIGSGENTAVLRWLFRNFDSKIHAKLQQASQQPSITSQPTDGSTVPVEDQENHLDDISLDVSSGPLNISLQFQSSN